MKCRDTLIKKIKLFSAKFDDYNNKFGKGQSPGSTLINGKNIYALPTLEIDISGHPFIKENIFEAAVMLPPRCTTIVIVAQYCEHHNISFVPQ